MQKVRYSRPTFLRDELLSVNSPVSRTKKRPSTKSLAAKTRRLMQTAMTLSLKRTRRAPQWILLPGKGRVARSTRSNCSASQDQLRCIVAFCRSCVMQRPAASWSPSAGVRTRPWYLQAVRKGLTSSITSILAFGLQPDGAAGH